MEISKMLLSDLRETALALNQSYDVAWAQVKDPGNKKVLAYIEKFYNFDPESCMVAIEHGEIIGAILGYTYNRKDSPVLFIQELFVVPNHRKEGVAKALLKTLRDSFDNNPQVTITPIIDAPESVLNFYNSLGFDKEHTVSFSG